MKIRDMRDAVDLLDAEWDLGKTASQSTGKICSWIFLMIVLEESETIIVKRENGQLVAFGGYAKWNSKKHVIRKKIYGLIKKILLMSPLINNKMEILKYHDNYDYTPKELYEYFDGEISVMLVNNKYRGKGIGKRLLLEIFDLAKKDNIKRLQILTDESCNFKFYENCDCRKIYEKIILNGEGNISRKAYIYEKRF